MEVETDDEVHRVDAIWLGPPNATFAWRARYVAYGLFLALFLIVLTVVRKIGFDFGFFTLVWSVIIAVVLTRLIGKLLSYERPFTQVLVMFVRELTAPRRITKGTGGTTTLAKVRVRSTLPKPRSRKQRREEAQQQRLLLEEQRYQQRVNAWRQTDHG